MTKANLPADPKKRNYIPDTQADSLGTDVPEQASGHMGAGGENEGNRAVEKYEIEITQEMVNDGVTALERFREAFDDVNLVRAIYTAMALAEDEVHPHTATSGPARATSGAPQDER